MGPDTEQLREHAATIIEFNRLWCDKAYNGYKDGLDTRVTDTVRFNWKMVNL